MKIAKRSRDRCSRKRITTGRPCRSSFILCTTSFPGSERERTASEALPRAGRRSLRGIGYRGMGRMGSLSARWDVAGVWGSSGIRVLSKDCLVLHMGGEWDNERPKIPLTGGVVCATFYA